VDPKRLRRIAQARIDLIEATVERWTAAYNQTHVPSRKPSRAGVRITGHSEHAITYSDPTGQTAALLLDELERVAVEMQVRKEADHFLAKKLEDFAPARQWDNGIRRCTEPNCARRHYAKGYCEPCYRRSRRNQDAS
jgi:pyocin large subunit-like protein